ncbi:MAG TPA: DUF3048 domain-containing protein [Acidimicrobiales bacterium]|nr:DUF3048 domain-containing protein [Acidimicrobiales bacterium]
MSDDLPSRRRDSERASRTPDRPSLASIAASSPTPLTRRELRLRADAAKKGATHAITYAVGAAVVVLVGAVIALFATSSSRAAAVKTPKARVSTSVKATAAPVPTCPLTGQPAPGGAVPARPALGVKIGNYTGDRPSSGLNSADIVFEEPVEGGITRLVAVFQCQAPALVGDLRSARQPDSGILSQLSDPLFVHAGGIPPVLSLMASSPLIDKDLYEGTNSSGIILQPGRVAPYSTFVNTATLWGFDPGDVTPPAPIFQYSDALPTAAKAGSGASVHIPFSGSSDVTWTWSPAGRYYLRSYAGTADTLLDGSPTAAANVVVMTVQTSTGAWVENEQGGNEVLVTTTGSGPVVVMRGGTAITGTWNRTSLTAPATLTAANGKPITLQPGTTWEELVPAGITVTPSPG